MLRCLALVPQPVQGTVAAHTRARDGSIPSAATLFYLPPVQGWDTTLRRSMKEVRILSVAPGGPNTLRYPMDEYRAG